MEKKRLPVGIDDYKKLIDQNYYYVDKTLFVKELLDNLAEVNLFTRPRRFGKTLNLSMLKYFFEKPVDGNSNAYLFNDKKIMADGGKYAEHQEQYPVIQLSLKSGKQADFPKAYKMMKLEIAKEYKRHKYILETMADQDNAAKFRLLSNENSEDDAWLEALAFLSRCLEEYHKQKVIILIDEYDVPLENAYYCGFYNEMLGFIRSLFESALKSNPSLKFAVITGCLRISKESIFTGLNNLKIISILNTIYSEHFGFIQREVDQMLGFYHLESKAELIKDWYDGYVFGRTEVYNPWSMVNYVCDLCTDKDSLPLEYWSNTSSNSIIKDLVCRADISAKAEIEHLISGGTIQKIVCETITYGDIYDSMDNLWNFLFFTGYLKMVSLKMIDSRRYVTLKIPNRELENIFDTQIFEWFRAEVVQKDMGPVYQSMLSGDAGSFERELSKLLYQSISHMDSSEAFYHGFLLGILINMKDYLIRSNRESGDGRYDICIKGYDMEQPPVILEFKIAEKYADLEAACNKALKQIEDRKYGIELGEEGYGECLHIGIGFWRKRCKVKCRRITLTQ